jgi:YggT family protein
MNFARAVSFLIGTLVDLYTTAVMLRLLLQWVRADFYNPVCQFLIRITNPLLIPIRRMVPSIGRLDTASLVLMFLLQALGTWLINQIGTLAMAPTQILLYALIKLGITLLMTYLILIIAVVILSWVGGRARHPLIPLLYQLTEPVLGPFRRVIPPIAGIDLSPLFALLTIRFLLLLLGW